MRERWRREKSKKVGCDDEEEDDDDVMMRGLTFRIPRRGMVKDGKGTVVEW